MTRNRLEFAAGRRRFGGLGNMFGPTEVDVSAGSDNRTIEGLEPNRVDDVRGRKAQFVLRREGLHH